MSNYLQCMEAQGGLLRTAASIVRAKAVLRTEMEQKLEQVMRIPSYGVLHMPVQQLLVAAPSTMHESLSAVNISSLDVLVQILQGNCVQPVAVGSLCV